MVSSTNHSLGRKKRGRPSKSVVRDRLREMLFVAGELTAYDAHKHYVRLFAKTSQRNIYYQLRKGLDTNLFSIRVDEEKGDFSWGHLSRKVYYRLSSKDDVRIDKRIVEYFREKNNQDITNTVEAKQK